MRIAYFCFITAALAALTGMGLGLYMGIGGDFTLAPAHAHLNLLGWVTMAVYGLYHRGVERQGACLAWVQVGCGAAGFPLMAGGLAGYLLSGDARLVAVVVFGALLSLSSMALFVVVLTRDAAWSAAPTTGGPRAFGW